MRRVLIATSQPEFAGDISQALSRGFRVDRAQTFAAVKESAKSAHYDFLFLDVALVSAGNGQETGKEPLEDFRRLFPSSELVILSPQKRIREAVELVRAGASDYLSYPTEPGEVGLVVESLLARRQREAELRHLREGAWRQGLKKALTTNSPFMAEVFAKVESVAPTISTVLLTGETGTGKSYMARVIHGLSNRAAGPFIAVHCGAIPESLVESELFGHEKGAFTGAVKQKMGKFQAAHTGTIFLDEVGTMPAAAQIKLLHVLQERQFCRVGGEQPIEVDVRVVAASNVDLEKLCENGGFRRDLFYRLNVFPIEMPRLRDRVEDIPQLVVALLEKLNRTHGKDIGGVDPEVLEALTHYTWPGNIRELENLVERAYILERGPKLGPTGFPLELLAWKGAGPSNSPVDGLPPLSLVRQRAVDQAERRYLMELLGRNQGRVNQSAAMAGVTTRQLHNLLTKHNLHKEDYRQI